MASSERRYFANRFQDRDGQTILQYSEGKVGRYDVEYWLTK